MKASHVLAIKCLENCFKRAVVRNGCRGARSVYSSSARKNTATAWESAKPFKEIPSPLMLPIIGTTWQTMPLIGRYKFERQQEANLDKMRRYGPIFREKFGPLDAVVCYNVEDLKELYENEGANPFRFEFSTLKAYREKRKEWYSTTGLLVLNGKEWYDLRTKTQKHLLKPNAIREYLGPMQNVARDFVQRMGSMVNESNEIPNFLHELYKWSLESVSLVGLDTRLGCLEPNLLPESEALRMIQSVLTQFECMNTLEPFSGNLQLWKLWKTPTWKKFEKASDVYVEIAFKYINQAVEKIKSVIDDEDGKLTLLQAMLAKKDLSVGDAMVFVGDMMMAGVETTSHSSGFLFYRLARNPDKQEKLYQEITKILPNKDHTITPKNYEEFRYLRACLKESMRLSPVIGGTARMLARDAILSGYQVPSGTHVFVPNDPIHMSEQYYKDPQKYLPERWMDKDSKPILFSFLPFGFGPRACIGRRLAELEIVSLVTEVVRNYKIEYHHEDIGYYTKMVNTPDKPLRFNFIKRTA